MTSENGTDRTRTDPTTRLTGRTAIVTGSTSGIGAAIARTLASEGAHVVVSGRDVARGRAAVKEVREAGGRADFVAADLAGTYEQLRAFVAEATSTLGGRAPTSWSTTRASTQRPSPRTCPTRISTPCSR